MPEAREGTYDVVVRVEEKLNDVSVKLDIYQEAHRKALDEIIKRLDGLSLPPIPIPTPIPPAEFGVLYNDTHSQLHQWLEANPTHPKATLLKEKIADVPKGIWISSNWNTNVTGIIKDAKAKSQMPVFIMYNAIKRDMGGESAGGAKNLDEYVDFCRGFADMTRGTKCIVILEPDALPHMTSMSNEEKLLRYKMFAKALDILGEHDVYIDAGHPEWLSVEDASKLLKEIGVSMAKGFSINVSNRISTEKCLEYGNNIGEKVGRPYVIDTSRNAIPHAGSEWCNPSPEGCGVRPTFKTGDTLCNAYLWLKSPGESDGQCNGGPSAGQLWIERAIQLAENSL